MCECIFISYAASLFGKNRDIFMALVCDMAKGRLADHTYFLEIVHDFMRKKAAGSYIQMIFIVCCFPLTGPNKEKIISFSYITDGVF